MAKKPDPLSGAPLMSNGPTRAASVVEHLRQALLDGRFTLGSRLNEVALSENLGVSRTPIRAALQMLAGEGLLLHEPNKGFTVRRFSVSDLVSAFEMRALAEGLAARLATERGLSEETKASLEQALNEGDAILKDPTTSQAQRTAYARINEVFHTSLHKAAGSSLVLDVVRICQQMPQVSAHNVMAFDHADIVERHRAHHEIYAAVIAHEPSEAELLMRKHVLWVKKSAVREFIQRKE
jgi:GntR family transcriptional regulator, vanillate catabolism transcriptional regulator